MNHPHTNDTDKHPKQDFQVERLAFFSDAVFAIAITLLIIEFKVPHVTKDSTYASVLEQLSELKVHLLALLLSFFFIAVYWVRHHSLFKYIHNYNQEVVIANTAALLPVIFLPFSTAFFAECTASTETLMLGLQVFFVNHCVAGLTLFALYWICTVRNKNMAYEMPLSEKLKFYEVTLFSSVMFFAVFISSLLTKNMITILGVMVVSVILRVVSMKVIKRRFTKAAA